MPRRRLVFLTKPGCGLCDVALSRVERVARWFKLAIDVVDITTDPALESQFHLRIPVLLDSKRHVLGEGQISSRAAVIAVIRARL